MSLFDQGFKVSYAYPLGYPIKVVIRRLNIRALLGWLFQKYAGSASREEILISERIVELPLLHEWLGGLGLKPGARVLEIGHVASSVSLELASLGFLVTGIDLRNYPFTHKNLTSFNGDFLAYDFKNQFDFIYSLSTIEHFGFTERYDGKKDVDNNLDEEAFHKIASLLKPSGKAVISVPYARELGPNTWFRLYTRDELNRKLGKHFNLLEEKFYMRVNNEWNEALNHSEDPDRATDGVAILLLSNKD